MLSIQEVFNNEDLMRHIFTFYPKRCGSCKSVMKIKFIPINSNKYNYHNYVWRITENEFCRGYCNWCCVYNFNHPY